MVGYHKGWMCYSENVVAIDMKKGLSCYGENVEAIGIIKVGCLIVKMLRLLISQGSIVLQKDCWCYWYHKSFYCVTVKMLGLLVLQRLIMLQ